jgi:Holliday junction resolvasome RuvABC ATP-dependent DNA helicase subunit
MIFENRNWKLDLDNLWWSTDRSYIRDSLLKHFMGGGGPAHLTGAKGAGKSTMAGFLSRKLKATVMLMPDDFRNKNDITTESVIIIDEAQKISKDDRYEIVKINHRVLMVSVQDLTDDGYELVHKIAPLSHKDIISYLSYKGVLNTFTESAIIELTKASKGGTRLINTICRAITDKYKGKIDKAMVEDIAKNKYKLRD